MPKPYPSFFYAIKSPYKLVYFLFLIPLLLIFLSILCKFAIYSFAVGEGGGGQQGEQPISDLKHKHYEEATFYVGDNPAHCGWAGGAEQEYYHYRDRTA